MNCENKKCRFNKAGKCNDFVIVGTSKGECLCEKDTTND